MGVGEDWVRKEKLVGLSLFCELCREVNLSLDTIIRLLTLPQCCVINTVVLVRFCQGRGSALSLCLCFCLFLSVSVSVCLSVFVFVSVCLSVCLSGSQNYVRVIYRALSVTQSDL